MATMITSEELECRDILNDVGIFFSDDFGMLDAGLMDGNDDDFIPISIPSTASPIISKHIRVSPPTTPETPASDALNELNLLAPIPRSVSQFSFVNYQQPQGMPTLPILAPIPTEMMVSATTMQRAVSDVSMTATQSLPVASNNRKRSLQGMLQTQPDPEEQIRRNRNREHAKRSRQRKKIFTDDLQNTLEALRKDTEMLRQELYSALGKEKVDAILKERERKTQEDFIAAMKIPKNRIMDASALKFLKGLSKKLPKQDEYEMRF